MVAMQEMMKGQKVNVLSGLGDKSADELQKIFNIKSQEEVDEILKRTSSIAKAVHALRDENSPALENFMRQQQRSIEKALKVNMDAMMNTKREIPDRNIDKAIDMTYHRKRAVPVNDYEQNKIELDEFHDYMLN